MPMNGDTWSALSNVPPRGPSTYVCFSPHGVFVTSATIARSVSSASKQ